jgi:hypothetical protein
VPSSRAESARRRARLARARRRRRRLAALAAVAAAGVVLAVFLSRGGDGGSPSGASSDPSSTAAAGSAKKSAVGTPAMPFRGKLMIADRGNNQILVVNNKKQVLWRYPGSRPKPKGGFYFPDDAFFTHHGAGIISNEEQNEAIVELSYPGGKVVRSFGHPGVIGSSPGYLSEPDDAYLLRNGTVTVADSGNCRILFFAPNGKNSQIGTTGLCTHNPPRSIAAPNGDTPLANGDVLVSEPSVSYIDEFTPSGHLVWSTHLPIAYPSDPQRIGPNRYLVADYTRPGGVYEFNRAGKILWSYHPSSGRGMLDHPSLAVQFPGGAIALNDDYRDRVVIIDRRTKRIIWQYGRTNHPGTGHNQLRIPDGLDLLAPSGRFPTHPYTG